MNARTEREHELVELVSAAGTATGSATVSDAHRGDGLLHRAFSVLLFDDRGRTLLQQRSATKTRFPLRWANACCGHPTPGEPVAEAATRRLGEELGVRGIALTDVGVLTYAATDPVTGRTEREYDHVMVGRVPPDLTTAPDPREVADLRWVAVAAVLDDFGSVDHAPWLAGVLRVALGRTGPTDRNDSAV
jgi:isopentenyl-diphosphate Delta-isomerase